MLGFVIGTICLVALIKLTRARRMWRMAACGYGPGAGFGHHHGWHGRGGWGGGGWGGWGAWHGDPRGGGPGWGAGAGPWGGGMLRHLFATLETTPGQEKVIGKAVEDVKAAVKNARGEIDLTRKDLARAFAAPSFDAEILGNAFARHDGALDEVRRAVTGALAQVHDALDEKQRARLIEMLEKGAFHA